MIWLFASLRFAVSRLTERMPAETKISILSSHFLSNLENRGHLRMRQSWFGEGALEKDFLLVPCNITYCPFTSCLLSSSVLIMCSDYQPSPLVPHGGGPPRQGDFHPGFPFPRRLRPGPADESLLGRGGTQRGWNGGNPSKPLPVAAGDSPATN